MGTNCVQGHLGDVTTFDESHAWFKSKGGIDATLNFQAKGKVSFHTGPVELFGLQNFGVTFRVPGIVTIGPNFRVIADVSGDATLQFDASYGVSFPVFDYEMTYPAGDPNNDKPEGNSTMPQENQPTSTLAWDLNVNGQVTVHIIPQIEFGIKFDSKNIDNAALNLGLDTYARVYANAHVSQSEPLKYCFGIDGGSNLFAQVQGPVLFGLDLNRYYILYGKEFDILNQTCNR